MIPITLKDAVAPTMAVWDEAAACLARGDFAGFDAAMRIYRQINTQQETGGQPNKRAGHNHGRA